MTALETPPQTLTSATLASFQRYYEEAGPDYAAWSPNFNMHFGYFRWGMNPFDREAMLEQMNYEIQQRLHVNVYSAARILDMGCGLGATLRSLAQRLPYADLHGITLVPWQLKQGRHLNQSHPNSRHITLALGDYEHTAMPSRSFDAVYAIESSCYANAPNKSAFLQEAHRLLRPGGRIVVADGFLGPGKLRGPQKMLFRKLCECWAIDTLGEVDQFTLELQRLGFQNIEVTRTQARVSPSVIQCALGYHQISIHHSPLRPTQDDPGPLEQHPRPNPPAFHRISRWPHGLLHHQCH